MTANRRTRITIESERVLIVTGEQSAKGRCEKCGREVNYPKPGQAGQELRTIPARICEMGPGQLFPLPAKNRLGIRLKSMLRSLKAASSRYKSW